MIVFLCFPEFRMSPVPPARGTLVLRRFHRPRRRAARGAAGERQQRNVARPFDGHAKPALMARANTGHAARQNLPALLHELGKNIRALVVDQVDLLDAELADLLLPEKLPLAAARTAGTAARSAFAAPDRSAFTTRSSRSA